MIEASAFASALLFLALGGCSKKDSGPDRSSPCGMAAGPLAGIVVLEVKDSGSSPEIMKTFESEVAAECVAQKADQTSKDALDCYAKNHGAIGYRLFQACPEQPGRAIVDPVVDKHGRRAP